MYSDTEVSIVKEQKQEQNMDYVTVQVHHKRC